MAKGKHLGAELGVGAGADQDEVDHEENALVGEAEKHAGGTHPTASPIRGQRPQRPSAEVYPEPASKASNRIHAERYAPQVAGSTVTSKLALEHGPGRCVYASPGPLPATRALSASFMAWKPLAVLARVPLRKPTRRPLKVSD